MVGQDGIGGSCAKYFLPVWQHDAENYCQRFASFSILGIGALFYMLIKKKLIKNMNSNDEF